VALVLRRLDDPSFEVELRDQALSIGADAGNDVRLAGDGIAGSHVRISRAAIEALADIEVGGVRLRAGRRRLSVPSVLRVGAITFMIETAAESSVATRELVLRALSGASSLWPRVIIVEGPSSGRELALQSDGSYVVGRDAGSDLAVDDPKMSRAHFEITLLEGALFVRDSGSTGGVWLGGSPLEPGRKAVWPAHRMVKAGGSVFAVVRPPLGLAKERPTSLSGARDAEPIVENEAAAGITSGLDDGTEPASSEPEPPASSPALSEEPGLSTQGAPPIARIDESPDGPAPINARSRDPFALRLAIIFFAIASASILVVLAYVLIS
jgi:Inner membrane component of T3SS, cytoplasmic domain